MQTHSILGVYLTFLHNYTFCLSELSKNEIYCSALPVTAAIQPTLRSNLAV